MISPQRFGDNDLHWLAFVEPSDDSSMRDAEEVEVPELEEQE